MKRMSPMLSYLFGAALLLGWSPFVQAAGQPDVLKPGAEKPANAVVLFDGTDTSHWEPAWPVKEGAIVSTRQDTVTKEKFTDYKLHLEFKEPVLGPEFKSQDRGNSGVYQQGRYEIQVLDSYNNDTYPKGGCASVYGVADPLKNAAKPPGEWQTYDITFHAPRVDDQGKVTEKGHVTVVFNGQTVIDNGAFEQVTGGALDEKIGEPGPLRLQDHGCKVRFRNIWLKPLEAK